MAWWQKKLLRYALRYGLSRTGLLEEEALDLDNLDVTIGKSNVIELKDVALNITRISKLAQLPPCLRLETARVLSLRLTIPADFYQSSIVVEVDGVHLVVRLEEEDLRSQQPQRSQRERDRYPAIPRTPHHRKTNQRLRSPPPHHPGGVSDDAEDLHVPTAEEVARSFLREEPAHERRELEATVAASPHGVEESFMSQSSDEYAGTGVGVGLPGFLSNFLQGIVDRFKLVVRNVQINLEADILGEMARKVPVTIRLKIDGVDVKQSEHGSDGNDVELERKWTIQITDLSIDVSSDDPILAELSKMPSRSSATEAFLPDQHPPQGSRLPSVDGGQRRPSMSSTSRSSNSAISHPIEQAMEPTLPASSPPLPPASLIMMRASHATVDADRFADAQDGSEYGRASVSSELDIRPGDDNISWGSRRSQASAPAEDLWKSMASEDDLPNSLVIQPERTATSQAASSQGSRSYTTRQRRAVSPYDRSLKSPGSWPRPDESPQRVRTQASPRSWPNLEQSHSSALEPLAQISTTANYTATDNQKNALASAQAGESQSNIPPAQQDSVSDNMLESRLFSHEDAQSMYMSAMTGSPTMAIPGGWGSDVQSQRSSSPEEARYSIQGPTMAPDEKASSLAGQPAYNAHSGNVTPRVQAPDLPSLLPTKPAEQPVVIELLYMNSLSISIPHLGLSPSKDSLTSYPSHSRHSSRSDDPTHELPGAFSSYSEKSASRKRGLDSVHSEVNSILWAPHESSRPSRSPPQIKVLASSVAVQLDISTGRLLYSLACRTAASLAYLHADTKVAKSDSASQEHPGFTFAAEAGALNLCLRERVEKGTTWRGDSLLSDGIIDVECKRINFSTGFETILTVGALEILLGGKDLLAFEHDVNTTTSHDLAHKSPIFSTKLRTRTSIGLRTVTEVEIQVAHVHAMLDLTIIDDTFSSFGGLSGMLELGNSAFSESGTSSPSLSKPPKGVRFVGDGESESADPSTELKVNARMSGITASLRGRPCSAILRTKTLKAVYRESRTVIDIQHISFTAPHLDEERSDAPISVTVASTRMEYLSTPHDKDLERLLSLLTPSHDKYDTHDDILLDTLLRQRRKGGLLRIAVGDTKIRIEDWDCLQTLAILGTELTKLSAVAKYLPEDERPGLLSLVRVKGAEAQIPVNDRFGKLCLTLQDLHLAHVALPALLALSVGSVGASQVDGPKLVHSFVPLSGADLLPVVMARMLGDEEEPIIKVKLYNICADYSVPVILALTKMDEDVHPEQVIDAMAQSVANWTMSTRPDVLERVPGSNTSKMVVKRTTIDLIIHDSAIGLTPQKLTSKALVVVYDAHVSTKVPPEDITTAKLELRKASLLITDHVEEQHEVPMIDPVAATDRLGSLLSQQGYVSVASIMSATVNFRAEESSQLESKKIEVDLKNELLLLETCADSTQTLSATLAGLIPPTPPTKIPRYLTEPAMPIEDLVNSFSGQALPVAEHGTEVLYDFEEEPEEYNADVSMAVSMFEEPDDLLAESAMTRSLYGPVSGFLGRDDNDRKSTVDDDYTETAESLLEEDPFEMTNADDIRLGDAALMRDLARQCKPAISDQPVDLGVYEIEDLGFDALSSGQQALGTQNRFNAPHKGAGERRKRDKQQDLPFRLRLREFHIIWHLYDGYDWQRTRDGIVEAVEQVEQRAEDRRNRRRQSFNDREDEESVIGDFLFNSIYIGVPSGHDAQELRRQINRNIDEEGSETVSIPISGISRPTTAHSASGQPRQRRRRRLKLGRSKNHKISFEVKGVSADVLVYPPGTGSTLSSVDLRLKEFEIFDKVPSSTWRKFLTHITSDPKAREMAKPMFHVLLDNVKTLESHSASEIRLHVTVLPLRLHVDQDALDFITRFFEFKDTSVIGPEAEGEKPFIQRIEVETVDLCLDYKPKTIDYVGLRSGKTTEFMNIITLEAANIRLKHAIAYGVKSFDELHPTLNSIWMPDITRNQLPTILAGLAPVRSLVNLGSGIRDVVAIPVREYRKDGRIVRSIQKGAFHFGKATTSELARLGAKVALGTQTLLSNAEGLLSPSEHSSSQPYSSRRLSTEQGWYDVASDDDESGEKRAVSAYADQPLGLLSGLRSARRQLEHDLLTAKDALIAVQGEVLESGGPGGIATALGRHAPTIILRPVIGGMKAVGTTLLGVGNQIDREGLRRVEDKYKPQ